MQFIKHFYLKTLRRDFINKFHYKDIKKIPKLERIILNFSCKNSELKSIMSCLLALEIISQQKCKITSANHSNVLLKIRKGNPIGCKVTLRKNKMFSYFVKNLLNIFPRLKNFNGLPLKNLKSCSFSYQIDNVFSFQELENNFYLFNLLPKLQITTIASTQTKKELIFLLKSFKLPIK